MGSCKVLNLKYVVEHREKLLLQRDSLMLSNLACICGRKKNMHFTFNSKSSMLVVFMDETLPPLIVNNCMYLFVVLKTDTVT